MQKLTVENPDHSLYRNYDLRGVLALLAVPAANQSRLVFFGSMVVAWRLGVRSGDWWPTDTLGDVAPAE